MYINEQIRDEPPRRPWRQAGVALEGEQEPKRMLYMAGLDWKVEKRPLFQKNNTEVSRWQLLVRATDGKELDIVSPKWHPIQNWEAFSVFDEFIKQGGMTMEAVGSVDDGKHVWALARTNEQIRLFGDDLITGYFLFSNPHKYGQTAQFGGTAIRIVCKNTLTLALKRGLQHRVKIYHRSQFDIEKVRNETARLRHHLSELQEQAEFLGSKRYKEETLSQYFQEIFPHARKELEDPQPSKNAYFALDKVKTQPGAEYREGTWWQAYNTVTYMVDHVVGSNDKRLDNAWFGAGKLRKRRALTRALEFAKAA